MKQWWTIVDNSVDIFGEFSVMRSQISNTNIAKIIMIESNACNWQHELEAWSSTTIDERLKTKVAITFNMLEYKLRNEEWRNCGRNRSVNRRRIIMTNVN